MENIQSEASLALARVRRICSGTDVLGQSVGVPVDCVILSFPRPGDLNFCIFDLGTCRAVSATQH